MFCTNCGNQVAPGAAFCTNCGNPMSAPPAEPAYAPEPAPVYAEPAPYTPEPAPYTPEPAPAYAEPAPAYNEPAQSADQGMNFDFSTNTATPASGTRYEYKILTQKDKWFAGKFDPLKLEQAINAYAQQGWRVVTCATADIPGFGGTARQEFITLLEREL